MEWLFSWEVTSVIVAIAVGSALAVLALNDFKLSKALFLLAAADGIGGIVVSLSRTNLSIRVQYLVVFVCGGLICIGLLAAWQYVNGKSPNKADDSKEVKIVEPLGFIQFEKSELQFPTIKLEAGKQLLIKYTIANRGLVPVHKVQTWGVIWPMMRDDENAVKSKETFQKTNIEAFEKFKDQGGTLGVNMENFNYAQLNGGSLSEQDLESLRSGKWALYFVAFGGWRDSKGDPHYWLNCQFINFPKDLDIAKAVWRTC
jgi:hypothetical protein